MNGPDEPSLTDEESLERQEMERIYRFGKPLVLFETSLGMKGFGLSCMRAGDGLAWVQGIPTINVFRGESDDLPGREPGSISIYGNVFLDVPSPGMVEHLFEPALLRLVRVGWISPLETAECHCSSKLSILQSLGRQEDLQSNTREYEHVACTVLLQCGCG